MKHTSIYKPHDKFFKEVFSRTEVAKSFIETYLIHRIGFQIDLGKLQLFQNDSVDSTLSEFLSDVIYCTEILHAKTPIYLLFEHKSKPDPRIGLQLENYIHMLRDHLTQTHSADVLIIIPVIIYHGKMKWDISSSIPSISKELSNASRYVQSYNYEFFDISHTPDKQIRGSALLRIVLITMKYIHNQQILTKLDDILVIFEELSKEENIQSDLNTFSLYVQSAAPRNLRQKLVQIIINWEKRGITMPEVSKVFQILKAEAKKEGREEGREEGKVEVASHMLQKGMSKELIMEITGLTMEMIVELERKIKEKDADKQ